MTRSASASSNPRWRTDERWRRVTVTLALAAGVTASGCRPAAPAGSRLVSEWMRTLYGTIRAERVSPPVASRLLAYAAAALYGGLAAVDTTMAPLTGSLNAFPALPRPEPGVPYDAVIVAVASEHLVLDSLLVEALPATRAALSRLADSLERTRAAGGVDDRVRARSVALGREVGARIAAWARSDGFDTTRNHVYVPPSGPGLWANDAPGSTFAAQNISGATQFVALDNPANVLRSGNVGDRALILNRPKRPGLAALPPVNIAGASEPFWGRLRPFVLRRWDACPLPPPPAYTTDTATIFYRDARAVYGTASTLSTDQRTIALYWADNAGESGTPPGHWISIAAQMADRHHLTMSEAARLMLVTAVSQADAFIASWGYKYRYNSVRPRPYIRSVIDSTWEPLIPSPPFPEYPSGHSTQSAAAASALAAMIGDAAFDDSTALTIGHSVRRFPSFTAAADEAGMSRIYAGIHFPFANSSGRTLGRCVAKAVLERLPVPPRS